MAPTKSGGYSSYKKTPPKKDEKPQRDIILPPANFLLKVPLDVSIALIMFDRSYQLQGTDAYYIYFSRTSSEFRKLLSDAGLEVSKRNFYILLKKLPELGWVSIPNPTEGDERSVWRYDKRGSASLYAFLRIAPRPCMVLKEGSTIEEDRALDEEINGYSTIGQEYEMPDVLGDEAPTPTAKPVEDKPLTLKEKLNLKNRRA